MIPLQRFLLLFLLRFLLLLLLSIRFRVLVLSGDGFVHTSLSQKEEKSVLPLTVISTTRKKPPLPWEAKNDFFANSAFSPVNLLGDLYSAISIPQRPHKGQTRAMAAHFRMGQRHKTGGLACDGWINRSEGKI